VDDPVILLSVETAHDRRRQNVDIVRLRSIRAHGAGVHRCRGRELSVVFGFDLIAKSLGT
jgi:hypothetical protein